MCNVEKVTKGQYYTKAQLWLKPQIIDFIQNSGCTIAYDPFAGAGDMLNIAYLYGIERFKGLDIDDSLIWEINDSLINIPHIDDAIIITNPPYLTNYSASRKKVLSKVKKYFDQSQYNDLYLIALDKMLQAQEYIVAIIPETFINSNYKAKNRLVSITILEDNLFEDTDTPVCIACFDGNEKSFEQVSVYKNETYVSSLQGIEDARPVAKKSLSIKFNVMDGWLGLRAVDTTNPNNMIHFDFKDQFDYDWEVGIKISSRLLSLIDINIDESKKQDYINECNKVLNTVRTNSNDIILSPFKGNMKNGVRRRRLDFYTARAIMEQAYNNLQEKKQYEQLRLF